MKEVMVVLERTWAGAGVSKVNKVLSGWMRKGQQWTNITSSIQAWGLCIYSGPSRNDVILSHRCAISKISIPVPPTYLTYYYYTVLVYYTTTGCMWTLFTALCGGVYVKRDREPLISLGSQINNLLTVVDLLLVCNSGSRPIRNPKVWMCLLSDPSRYL